MHPIDVLPCPLCELRLRRRCRLCGGSGRVTRALREIYSAHRLARALAPEWRGADDQQRPGVTIFSLAAYYRRRRFLRGKVVSARGRPGHEEAFGVVELVDGDGRPLTALRGLAWGYGGEGPSGLAAILADALPGLFPTMEDARRFVMALPQDEPWAITATGPGSPPGP